MFTVCNSVHTCVCMTQMQSQVERFWKQKTLTTRKCFALMRIFKCKNFLVTSCGIVLCIIIWEQQYILAKFYPIFMFSGPLYNKNKLGLSWAKLSYQLGFGGTVLIICCLILINMKWLDTLSYCICWVDQLSNLHHFNPTWILAELAIASCS